jgi:exopolyphosphatase / guanosine-5'-triphosphate,3'-diphosphate pyrophosphatase
MRVASIDIGTNTILMLIAEINAERSLTILRDEHAIARMGKGVDANRIILPDTFRRVLSFLKTYILIARQYKVDKIIACGTSALRDARNKEDFIKFIYDQSGVAIRILSGKEEASMTYHGAIWGMRSPDENNPISVLDIGGGSTELIHGTGKTITYKKSIDVGSVRLTERFLKTSPPSADSVRQAEYYMQQQCKEFSYYPNDSTLYGVAGTLTTLACIDQQLSVFTEKSIHGYRLRSSAIENIYKRMRLLSLEEIKNLPCMVEDRADIILAGILILLAVMNHFAINTITVSTQGLRSGIMLDGIS